MDIVRIAKLRASNITRAHGHFREVIPKHFFPVINNFVASYGSFFGVQRRSEPPRRLHYQRALPAQSGVLWGTILIG